VTSELAIVGREDEMPSLGQPDRVIHLIPYFHRGPSEARLAYAR
jgi:hypothetical protein